MNYLAEKVGFRTFKMEKDNAFKRLIRDGHGRLSSLCPPATPTCEGGTNTTAEAVGSETLAKPQRGAGNSDHADTTHGGSPNIVGDEAEWVMLPSTTSSKRSFQSDSPTKRSRVRRDSPPTFTLNAAVEPDWVRLWNEFGVPSTTQGADELAEKLFEHHGLPSAHSGVSGIAPVDSALTYASLRELADVYGEDGIRATSLEQGPGAGSIKAHFAPHILNKVTNLLVDMDSAGLPPPHIDHVSKGSPTPPPPSVHPSHPRPMGPGPTLAPHTPSPQLDPHSLPPLPDSPSSHSGSSSPALPSSPPRAPRLQSGGTRVGHDLGAAATVGGVLSLATLAAAATPALQGGAIISSLSGRSAAGVPSFAESIPLMERAPSSILTGSSETVGSVGTTGSGSTMSTPLTDSVTTAPRLSDAVSISSDTSNLSVRNAFPDTGLIESVREHIVPIVGVPIVGATAIVAGHDNAVQPGERWIAPVRTAPLVPSAPSGPARVR